MQENRNTLLTSAMQHGWVMGLYWVFKYLFFIFSLQKPFLTGFYWGFTILVPYLAFRMTWSYRRSIGGTISFFHAWQFGVLVYFFGAMIVSLAHYGFYRYLAPADFLTNSINEAIRMLPTDQLDSQLVESLKATRITPIQMAIQGILNNVFYGMIFSLPVATLLHRKPSSGQAE